MRIEFVMAKETPLESSDIFISVCKLCFLILSFAFSLSACFRSKWFPFCDAPLSYRLLLLLTESNNCLLFSALSGLSSAFIPNERSSPT